ncbi:hypothetical protein BDV29DRAFT_152842 [Aspergillus leporis]|uniref:Oxidoreductase AflY n=1 Tax=Aspergillus leporis TaxID=41062 RepID=A0A5N5XC31_9EURO|nr:hypothetical protein BDV29DRAFT_152842 [Aspergillus leporis]
MTSTKNVDLTPVPSFNLGSLPDERSKTLQSLLQQNHQDHAVLLDPRLIFHNHMPHMLGSAYLLGFPPDKLVKMYQNEALRLKGLDSRFIRTGITGDNWRDFLGKKKYTAAYTDFFDQEVSNNHGDWKKVVNEYLLSSPQPLIHGFVGGRKHPPFTFDPLPFQLSPSNKQGVGHPFIHLAYAYEFSSPEIATEALSLGCTERDPIHRYLDTPYPDTSTYKSTSPKTILQCVRDDARFSGLFSIPGYNNIATIFAKAESAILDHWNAWDIVDPARQLREIVEVAGILLMESRTKAGEYDFFLAHALTVGHALRVLLPVFRGEWRVDVLRQFWLFVLFVYVAQLRPGFKGEEEAEVMGFELGGRGWGWVCERCVEGEVWDDAHRVKVVRAFRMLGEWDGEKDGWYLRAAVRFVEEFRGWTGFGAGVEGIEGEE